MKCNESWSGFTQNVICVFLALYLSLSWMLRPQIYKNLQYQVLSNTNKRPKQKEERWRASKKTTYGHKCAKMKAMKQTEGTVDVKLKWIKTVQLCGLCYWPWLKTPSSSIACHMPAACVLVCTITDKFINQSTSSVPRAHFRINLPETYKKTHQTIILLFLYGILTHRRR